MPTISIKISGIIFEAELNDTRTAGLFSKQLPMAIPLSRWGDEYYGGCGVTADSADDQRDILEVGELALWPPGKAFCIFFGPTPASTDERPRAASDVVPLGKIISDLSPLGSFSGLLNAEIY